MAPRAVIPTLRAILGIRGVPWRLMLQGQRALRRTRPLQTAPAPSAILSPLPCLSSRGGYSSAIATRNYSTASPPERDPLPSTTGQDESAVKKTSEPLNILFCGSDEFSCASLAALHEEHVRNPALIRSIEVVVRPGKRIGRGLKIVRDPPIRALAENLGLRIHERDTFTGWDMPPQTNLIIAVSFGLFVPARLLRAARYGGLNLHPSLLPDLRGPAPLHHALLRRRALAGVSLQTLHPEHFDRGVVLAQTPADPALPGALRIPATNAATARELLALVTPPAAQMLVRGLRDGLHVPPLVDRGWEARLLRESGADSKDFPAARERVLRGFGGDVGFGDGGGGNGSEGGEPRLVHAPKITTADRQVRLSMLLDSSSSCSVRPGEGVVSKKEKEGEEEREGEGKESTLALRQRVIGPLWFYAVNQRDGSRKRIIIDSLQPAPPPPSPTSSSSSTEAPESQSSSSGSDGTPQLYQPDTQPLTSLRGPPPPTDEKVHSSSNSNPPTRLVIAFVENTDPITTTTTAAGAADTTVPEHKITYLSLATGPGGAHGAVYLSRDGRAERLKVEGERAKPPRLALRSFVVGEVLAGMEGSR